MRRTKNKLNSDYAKCAVIKTPSTQFICSLEHAEHYIEKYQHHMKIDIQIKYKLEQFFDIDLEQTHNQ